MGNSGNVSQAFNRQEHQRARLSLSFSETASGVRCCPERLPGHRVSVSLWYFSFFYGIEVPCVKYLTFKKKTYVLISLDGTSPIFQKRFRRLFFSSFCLYKAMFEKQRACALDVAERMCSLLCVRTTFNTAVERALKHIYIFCKGFSVKKKLTDTDDQAQSEALLLRTANSRRAVEITLPFCAALFFRSFFPFPSRSSTKSEKKRKEKKWS